MARIPGGASLSLLLACSVALSMGARPAEAVPDYGLYGAYSPSGSFGLETSAPDGVLEIDYVPTMTRPDDNGSMQVLQAAARVPAPILNSALTLRGLLGYQQQWAYYTGGIEDTYGGLDLGMFASLKLDWLPYCGEYLQPLSLVAYGLGDRLITAKANGQGFDSKGLILPTFGGGISLLLPTKGQLYLGWESWAVPQELGSGRASFSGSLRVFTEYVLGYRW